MEYFFYNTDAGSIKDLKENRFQKLIQKGFAITGGDYKKFGEQFRKLHQDDVLLMYQNKVGVVAIGKVMENWDGKGYTDPCYYSTEELKSFDLGAGAFEYKIKVDWYHNLSEKPIILNHLRERFQSAGFTPRGAVKIIRKYHYEVEEMLSELIP